MVPPNRAADGRLGRLVQPVRTVPNPEGRLFEQIQLALAQPGLEVDLDRCRITGRSAYGAVSDLATGSVAGAAAVTADLIADAVGARRGVDVDRGLVDRWCRTGYSPVGWRPTSVWDPFARDYQTADGCVRLHTNAAHHRSAALSVLGGVDTPEAAETAIAQWESTALEQAIYAAGGCGVELRTGDEWARHQQGVAVAGEPAVRWQQDEVAPIRWTFGSPERPLAGLKVLDLTRVIAGPVSTRFLASLGADVLRIDPPGWSDGLLELDMTVGKACAGLDLKDAADRAVFESLIVEADLMVVGYRADALDRLGFDDQRIRTLNPGLIEVRLNAFGWTGPWRNRRGFDSLVQRSSGLAVAVDGGVMAMPYQILDHATGYLSAAAAIQLVRARRAGIPVVSARLSLARQAQMLLDLGATADVVGVAAGTETVGVDDDLEPVEGTGLGPIRRLRLPYAIDDVNLSWQRPSGNLRSSAARFSV